MNKLALVIGGAIFIAEALLVEVFWGWLGTLAFVIGLCLFALIVLARGALLRPYLKTFSRKTMLTTNPLWAGLYRSFYPRRQNQPNSLDAFSPSQRRDVSEDL